MLSVKYKCFNIGWPQGNTYWCIQSNSKIKQSAVICVFVRACEKKCMWVFMLCKSMPYCFNPFNILNNIPCIILLNYYLECLYKFPYTGDSTCFSISFRNTYCNWLTLTVTFSLLSCSWWCSLCMYVCLIVMSWASLSTVPLSCKVHWPYFWVGKCAI